MARIYPFRAWRFNPSLVRLSDVVTQPAEKISPALQQAYYQRSPYNLVRITLGLPELFDAERGETTCTRAARDFKAWREQGILHHEKEFCVFAYAQRFTVPDSDTILDSPTMERRGFIALGKLYDYSDQVVFPHQETPPEHKNAQLSLLRATHAQFDPILMLYSDPARTVERILYDDNGPADFEISDENDVLHRLWKITDPAAIRLLTAAMSDKKLILAEGQDRYEAALAYSREHTHPSHATSEHNPSQLTQPPTPASAVLMNFVNMDAEGLVILPTHCVVHSLPNFNPAAFFAAAAEFFTLEPLPATDASFYIETLQKQQGTAFVAVTRSSAQLLRSKPDVIALALDEISPRQRELDLIQLHSILLTRLLGLDAQNIREQTNLRSLRDPAEAVDQVRRGQADIAFLTNPVSIEQLREVAFAGEVMPQKSTAFFPNLLSGLAIYALD